MKQLTNAVATPAKRQLKLNTDINVTQNMVIDSNDKKKSMMQKKMLLFFWRFFKYIFQLYFCSHNKKIGEEAAFHVSLGFDS